MLKKKVWTLFDSFFVSWSVYTFVLHTNLPKWDLKSKSVDIITSEILTDV